MPFQTKIMIAEGNMPTKNISLPEELARYVDERVESGHYDNASEVIRAALRELIQAEDEDRAKVAALRAAVAEGMRGPTIDGPTFMAELRHKAQQMARHDRKKAV
jgi:antitoxin ParD1/3/4